MKNIFYGIIYLLITQCYLTYKEEQYELKNYLDFNSLVQGIKLSPLMNTYFKYYDVFKKFNHIRRPVCESDFSGKCKNYLIELTKFEKGKDHINSLPTVLLIGGFHGNEVTGSNSLYNLVKIFQRYLLTNDDLSQLLDNVRILILPIVNAEGFSNGRREEMVDETLYDPNRDFPYNLNPDQKCFKTTTAQIIDAIYKNYMIVGTLTYHGGDNSITYPWGNFAHEEDPITGDDIAFSQLAKFLQTISGENKLLKVEEYKIGTMQDIVYDVGGGFEDWAYAASWDTVNVSKTCGVDTGYQIINYTDTSNRAFVYLIEAGYDKIPDEEDLGNELSIFEPDNENAIWGHISRNTYLSLKFSELMKPFISISEMVYDKGLIIKFTVKGCHTLNEVSVDDRKFVVVSSQKEENTGYHLVELVVTQINKYMHDIGINIKCDSDWRNPTHSNLPQSHLVKLRTDPKYKIESGNTYIKSQETIKSIILNTRIARIKDSYLLPTSNNIFSFVYNKRYKIDLPGNQVFLSWEDGELVVEKLKDIDYHLSILRFGTSSCCTENTNGDSPIFDINTQEVNLQISQRIFYELLGKFVIVSDPNTGVRLFYSKIENENNDSYSNLMIPQNGLTCSSESLEDYFYLRLFQMGKKKVKVELFTNHKKKFKVEVGNLEAELLPNDPFLLKADVFNYYSIVELDHYNDLRLLGSILSLIKLSEMGDKLLFTCSLGQLNPDFDELKEIPDFKEFKRVILHHKEASKPLERQSDTTVISIATFFFVVIFIGIVYLLNKYLAEIEKAKLKEQENLDVSEELSN